MKRKTRKRLAKEAEIARKEAAGDYSHLKGKDGKMRAAPLPQPTLPKIGLANDEFYAPSYRGESDAGSIRNGGGSVRYGPGPGGCVYPPPSGLGGGAPYLGGAGAGGWAGNGPSGLSHQQSYRAQPQYAPYAQSDAASIVHPNESVSSFDAFAAKGQPMGYNSSAALVGPDGRPNLQRGPTGRSYAPSYRSDRDDELAYYSEKNLPPQQYEEADARLGMASPPPLNPLPSSLQHALSNASSVAANNRAYVPPSRDQLYRRATDRPESFESHGGDVVFGGAGGGHAGPWGGPHQHQAYSQSGHGHEQEQLWEPVPPPSQQGQANFAGRGAGAGGGQWR